MLYSHFFSFLFERNFIPISTYRKTFLRGEKTYRKTDSLCRNKLASIIVQYPKQATVQKSETILPLVHQSLRPRPRRGPAHRRSACARQNPCEARARARISGADGGRHRAQLALTKRPNRLGVAVRSPPPEPSLSRCRPLHPHLGPGPGPGGRSVPRSVRSAVVASGVR